MAGEGLVEGADKRVKRQRIEKRRVSDDSEEAPCAGDVVLASPGD